MTQEEQNKSPAPESKVVELLEEMKVDDVRVLELEGHSLFDFFVVGTCTSSRHLKSSSDHVRYEIKQAGHHCFSVERSDDWVAMDLDTVALHLFLEDVRDHYDLEGLWAEGKLDVGLVENFLKGRK